MMAVSNSVAVPAAFGTISGDQFPIATATGVGLKGGFHHVAAVARIGVKERARLPAQAGLGGGDPLRKIGHARRAIELHSREVGERADTASSKAPRMAVSLRFKIGKQFIFGPPLILGDHSQVDGHRSGRRGRRGP